MRPISSVVGSIQAEFKQSMDRAKEQNQRRIREQGWPADVTCIECGDSGVVPETERTCWCSAGRQIVAQRNHAESWQRDIPPRYSRYTLDGHPDPRARAAGTKWLESEPWNAAVGSNLVIAGPVGTGKTGLAIGVLRVAHHAGVKMMYTNVPDILLAMTGLKWEDKHRQMSKYQNMPLMLLDDLGAEHVSDWSASMLYEVIEGRYRNGAPTIVTTNLSKRQLREAVGDRVVSRLWDGATELDLGGNDLRKPATPVIINGTGVRK